MSDVDQKGHGFLLQKPCGECTACCSGPLIVPEYNISWGNPCEHLCESGCGNYEGRQKVCRIFSCAWKTNFVPDRMRPDKSGIICKWDEDGSMALVPIDDKLHLTAVEFWKSFAKKMNQDLGMYDRVTDSKQPLVYKREKAIA